MCVSVLGTGDEVDKLDGQTSCRRAKAHGEKRDAGVLDVVGDGGKDDCCGGQGRRVRLRRRRGEKKRKGGRTTSPWAS